MTKFNVTAKFLDNLPLSVKSVRFEYYDRRIDDVWVIDWERSVYLGKSYWDGGGDEVKTSVQMLKYMNAELSPSYINKPRVLFATKFKSLYGHGNDILSSQHHTLAEMKKMINK
jgi:hypothetical protein